MIKGPRRRVLGGEEERDGDLGATALREERLRVVIFTHGGRIIIVGEEIGIGMAPGEAPAPASVCTYDHPRVLRIGS